MTSVTSSWGHPQLISMTHRSLVTVYDVLALITSYATSAVVYFYHASSASTPLGRGCDKSHTYITSMSQWSTRKKPSDFCCFRCVIKQTSKVLCSNICWLFSPDFIFFLPQWHSHPSFIKMWMFLISTPHNNRTFTVRLTVSTDTKETVLQQRCWLDATIQDLSQLSHRKTSYSIFNIGNMMKCDHQVVSQSVYW